MQHITLERDFHPPHTPLTRPTPRLPDILHPELARLPNLPRLIIDATRKRAAALAILPKGKASNLLAIRVLSYTRSIAPTRFRKRRSLPGPRDKVLKPIKLIDVLPARNISTQVHQRYLQVHRILKERIHQALNPTQRIGQPPTRP